MIGSFLSRNRCIVQRLKLSLSRGSCIELLEQQLRPTTIIVITMVWLLRHGAFRQFVRFYPLLKMVKNEKTMRMITSSSPNYVKVATFSTLFSLSFLSSSKPNLAQVLKEADKYFDENKCSDIVKVLNPHKDEKNDEVLWRLGRAIYTMSKDVTDQKQKKAMVFEAYEYILEALSVNKNNFAVHKWMSIMISATSEYKGIKEKITQAHVMKQHMLRATELNPKDATVLYLLGSWCFEVASMAWYERKIASTIFAAPPNSSFEEALSYFIKAEEADPHFYSMNFLMLGKTYLKLNNKEKAMHYLKLAQDYSQKTADDAQAKNEATSLLKQL